MKTKTISKRYTEAILKIAQENNKISEYSKQLEMIDSIIDSTPIVQYAWYENKLAEEEKKQIIKDFFNEKVDSILVDFLCLLIDKKRESYLKEITKEYMNLSNVKEGYIEVSVGTVVELSEKEIEKLKKKLSDMTGKKIRLKMKVVPDIIGGIVLKIGDKIIDNSVVKRLSLMGKELENTSYTGDDYLKKFLLTSEEAEDKSEIGVIADVTSSIVLPQDKIIELEKKLSEKMGQKVIINAKVDESLLGGITVKIGDKVIDGSGRKLLLLLEKKMENAIGNWGEE